MLSLNECRKLITDSSFSDEEMSRIRAACYELADIALEHIDSQKPHNGRLQMDSGDDTATSTDLHRGDL